MRHLGAKVLVGEKPAADREPSMNEITTVGLDLAKHVFQVHAVDAGGTRFCASSFGGRMLDERAGGAAKVVEGVAPPAYHRHFLPLSPTGGR